MALLSFIFGQFMQKTAKILCLGKNFGQYLHLEGGESMKKINILKNNRDFNRIIDTYKANKYKDFVIYIERTNDEFYHFGISVGKKIGNAVTRNKYKRRIRAIIDKKNYQKGINCIIILRKSILERDYIEIENSLLKAFRDLKITKE